MYNVFEPFTSVRLGPRNQGAFKIHVCEESNRLSQGGGVVELEVDRGVEGETQTRTDIREQGGALSNKRRKVEDQ